MLPAAPPGPKGARLHLPSRLKPAPPGAVATVVAGGAAPFRVLRRCSRGLEPPAVATVNILPTNLKLSRLLAQVLRPLLGGAILGITNTHINRGSPAGTPCGVSGSCVLW